MEKLISFIIPCYCSEKTIEPVVEEIIYTVTEREGYNYEIILVNDSSPDHVQEVIHRIAFANRQIKAIDLARNFGQHAALMCGLRYASGDFIVCMDDDGQTPPCEVFRLINALDENTDIAIAKYSIKRHSWFRNLGSKMNDYMTQWLLGKPKSLSFMSFFAFKHFLLKEIIRYKNPYPYINGMFLRATNRICNVEIQHRERLSGKSGYTIKKLLSLWLNGFTAFSVKPLRIATLLGTGCALLGFFFGIYTIINKLLHPMMLAGYSSLMAVLLFVGGMIMMMLGMIGEYVGRIYISINNSPQYVIRETINCGEIKE